MYNILKYESCNLEWLNKKATAWLKLKYIHSDITVGYCELLQLEKSMSVHPWWTLVIYTRLHQKTQLFLIEMINTLQLNTFLFQIKHNWTKI